VQQALDAGIALEKSALEASQHDFVGWWTSERCEELRREFNRYVSLDEPQAPAAEASA
jgi:hypothetical protein